MVMKRPLSLFVVPSVLAVWLLALGFPAAQSAPTTVPSAADIPGMLAEVAQDRLAETIAAMSSVRSRFALTEGCRRVGTSIFNYFSRLGLAAQYEEFKYNALGLTVATGRNVSAEIRGTTAPERVIVVGAHYDSYSRDDAGGAPGADDNASGTAAILEIARVLSQHPLAMTVRVVAFDAEELGLHGSRRAVETAKKKHDDIEAMVNLDMVAFSAAGKRGLAVVPDKRSQWLADLFLGAIRRYGIDLRAVKKVDARWARSDQASFWSAGYPAIGLVEEDADSNPYYHRATDTTDRLDMALLVSVTRATLATVAELAQRPAA